MASHVSRVFLRTYHTLLYDGVALVSFLSYLLSTIALVLSVPCIRAENQDLRTIIVIADIDRGLYSASTHSCERVPTVLDLPALVRHHPLYFLLRVRRELCFW